MKIEPIDGGRLRVWLDDQEAEELSLHTEHPEHRSIRRLVAQILASVGRRPAGRMTAEMIPVEGGWVLLISPALRPDTDRPAVYYLPDADALLELIRLWHRPEEGTRPHCALYEVGEGYHLAVYPDEPLTDRQEHLLLEYGSQIGTGEGVAAHAAEYGSLIAAGDILTDGGQRLPEPGDPTP